MFLGQSPKSIPYLMAVISVLSNIEETKTFDYANQNTFILLN